MAGGAAQSETLTDALIHAYRNSPTLEINRANLRGLDESVVQSSAAQKVTVTASGNVSASTSSSSTRDITDTYRASLDASLMLYDGGASDAAIKAAAASIDSSRARLVEVEQSVLLSAIAAYVDIRRDERFVALAENNVMVITQEYEAAQDRFEVGEVTRTDVSLAESRLAGARSNLAVNRGSLEASRQAYLVAIGRKAGQLAPPPALPRLPATLAEAQAIAMREHPSVKAAQAALVAAEFDVVRARAAKRPTVTLNGGLDYDINSPTYGSDNTSASVSLNASVPLLDGGRNDSLIRQALAVLDSRKAELQNTARTVKQSTALAWSQLDVSRASIRASRQEIRAARVAFEGIQEEAKLGARTTLDVLDAEQDVLNAESNQASAERDEYVAAYNLVASMGLLNVRYLGLGIAEYNPDINYQRVTGTTAVTSRESKVLDRIGSRWGN